jgi:hypothetical protein
VIRGWRFTRTQGRVDQMSRWSKTEGRFREGRILNRSQHQVMPSLFQTKTLDILRIRRPFLRLQGSGLRLDVLRTKLWGRIRELACAGTSKKLGRDDDKKILTQETKPACEFTLLAPSQIYFDVLSIHQLHPPSPSPPHPIDSSLRLFLIAFPNC